MPPLTHEERAARRKKIAAYCRRRTCAEAAIEFGVSTSTVHSACQEHGVVYRSAYSEPAPTKLQLVAALVNTTTSLTELARQHRVSRQAVHLFKNKCVAAGLKVLPRR